MITANGGFVCGVIISVLSKMPVVEITATVIEQTNCYTLRSLGMMDLEITAINPNKQNSFYTCSAQPHTGHEKTASSSVHSKTKL